MSLNNIRNYYEKIIYDRIVIVMGNKSYDDDYLEDIACVALNHLPPRYIRHEVDMIFYMSPMERQEMEDKIDNAITNAVAFIKENRGKRKKR